MRRGDSGPRRRLTTVLFTDIVGSTSLATELGDRQWRQILTRHHSVIRRNIKRLKGREIDTAGDGFFAIFDQPADAIECAVTSAGELSRLGIDIRAGVHMGEVEIDGDDVSGIAVHVGARVMSTAGANEVMVSGTVRELMTGSDIRFEDRGMHELKGVSAQQHLFSVAAPEVEAEPEPAHPALAPDLEAEPDRRRRRRNLIVSGIGAAVIVALLVVLLPAVLGGGSSANALPAGMVLMDARTWKQKAFIPTSKVKTPVEVIYAEGHFWVLNLDPISFVEIDPESGGIIRQIASPADDVGFFAVDGDTLWVSDFSKPALYKMSISRSRVVTTISTAQDPSDPTGNAGVAVGAGSVWVVHRDGGPVLRIDPDTGKVQQTFTEPRSPNSVAFGDGTIWTAGGPGISSIDPSTGRVKFTRLPLSTTIGSYTAAAGGYGWTSDESKGVVYQIDRNGALAATFKTGDGARALSFADGEMWVGNQDVGTVTAIDVVTGETRVYHLGHPLQAIAAGSGVVLVQMNPGRTYEDRIDALQGDVARLLVSPYQLDPGDPAIARTPLAFQVEYTTCAPLLTYGDTDDVPPRLVPEAAASVPTVSNDGRTYTFTVRKGFRFSPPSNQAVTAETFRYSIERALSPEVTDAAGPEFVDDIAGEQAFLGGKADHISGLRATGDRLIVTLVKPSGSFLARLSAPFFCPVPTDSPIVAGGAVIKASGPAGSETVPGSGPYYIADHFNGEYTILKPNPGYGGSRPQELDAIALREGVDPGESIQRVQDGSWDGMTNLFDPSLSPYGSLPTSSGGDARYTATAFPALDYLALNASRPLFASAKVRRAVALAVDRTELAKTFDELAVSSLLPPNLVGEDGPYSVDESDVARARKLVGPGRHAGVMATYAGCDPCDAFADELKAQLAEIGIDLTIRAVDDAAAEAAKPGSDIDIFNPFVGDDFADAPSFLSDEFTGSMPASWLPHGVQERVEALDRLEGARREAEAEKVAESLARDEVPVVAFGAATEATLLSPRLGCTVIPPYGYGLDLAALCLA